VPVTYGKALNKNGSDFANWVKSWSVWDWLGQKWSGLKNITQVYWAGMIDVISTAWKGIGNVTPDSLAGSMETPTNILE